MAMKWTAWDRVALVVSALLGVAVVLASATL